ncbi:MAG: nucleotidyltransferase domain-containing protein, partial [Proteobacteria bacterium]|nr:nucleotidyltransferase domain-containing protein [Pseudomonadota bacterium]
DKEKLRKLSENYGIQFILLFGSKAEGTDTPESDTDIAVYADHVLSEEEKINLAFELSPILKTENIDLVDIKISPPILKKKIFDNYKALFVNNSFLLYQVELSVLREYEESKILYKIRDERLKDFAGD